MFKKSTLLNFLDNRVEYIPDFVPYTTVKALMTKDRLSQA